MRLMEHDMAVDMGTATTRLFSAGRKTAITEPTVVIVDKTERTIIQIGDEAYKTLGRTPANAAVVFPVSSGVISDYDMSVSILEDLVKKVKSFSFFKPRMLFCVPGSITGVEERATIDAAIQAGAGKVYLVESAVAAAVGAGVKPNMADGHLVVDVGAGTTEIAVVSMGGVVDCESIKVAGNAFDEEIIRYIKRTYNVLIGEKTAETIKIDLGSVDPSVFGEENRRMEVKGRNLLTGMPETIEISSRELCGYDENGEVVGVLIDCAARIVENILNVIERTPPEITSDIASHEIILCGGGSQLRGLDKLIAYYTQLGVITFGNPAAIITHGARQLLNNLNNMEPGMRNFSRNRQLL